MTRKQALELMMKFAGFKLLVETNRLDTDSQLARAMHDNAILVLEAHIGDLSDLFSYARAMQEETDPARRKVRARRFRRQHDELEQHLAEAAPYALGGWQKIEGDSYRDPVTGRTEPFDGRPVTQIIPWERLCGLASILDALEAECEVRFDYEIVFYRPRTAGGGQEG